MARHSYIPPTTTIYAIHPVTLCTQSTVDVTFTTTVNPDWDGQTHDIEMSRTQSTDIWSNTLDEW